MFDVLLVLFNLHDFHFSGTNLADVAARQLERRSEDLF